MGHFLLHRARPSRICVRRAAANVAASARVSPHLSVWRGIVTAVTSAHGPAHGHAKRKLSCARMCVSERARMPIRLCTYVYVAESVWQFG